MKDSSIKVLYIAGNGHSGSTLLDIIIGKSTDIFSAGEITFITRDSIFDEYCSCHKLIKDCRIWSSIIKIWQETSVINIKEYRKLRLKFERNKATLNTIRNIIKPSNDFIKYCNSTLSLFQAIQKVTGKSIIVDSSKSPQRIAILRRIVDLKVIHLCRNASGVLNSAKKTSKKDIRAGREIDSPARGTFKTLTEWCFVNIITELFCIGVKSDKIKYKDYIKNLNLVETLHPSIKLENILSFRADHMLAGNTLRLEKVIKINQSLGFKYKRLTSKQIRIANVFEFVFPFWS
tara:strand:- start:48 stop:917 length:870 start_codon:yes stop_codon:yes gene_type:complete